MDELKFVMKCFLFASLVMVFSQVKSGGLTLESRVEVFLTESTAAHFMQTAAEGGAKVLGEMYETAKNFISNKIGHASSSPTMHRPVAEPIEVEEDRI
ncbi:MAG: hypothetical protein H7256_10395 [Bdellovibrio sp.]|nr:hypothetical protein [Bdellovibrio sp.]